MKKLFNVYSSIITTREKMGRPLNRKIKWFDGTVIDIPYSSTSWKSYFEKPEQVIEMERLNRNNIRFMTVNGIPYDEWYKEYSIKDEDITALDE